MTNIENKVKTVWSYDKDGFFDQTHVAQLDPRKPGTWLFPDRTTTVKPELKAKTFYKIREPGNVDSGWNAIPYPSCARDFVGVEIPHQSRTIHDQTLRDLLRAFVKADSEHWKEKQINDADGNLLAITVEEIPEPTEEEKRVAKETEIRAKRDSLLAQCEYLVQPDYPISDEERQLVYEYRQQLRDVPQQEGFPFDVIWPEMPTVHKLR